jgi:hypothetical protein
MKVSDNSAVQAPAEGSGARGQPAGESFADLMREKLVGEELLEQGCEGEPFAGDERGRELHEGEVQRLVDDDGQSAIAFDARPDTFAEPQTSGITASGATTACATGSPVASARAAEVHQIAREILKALRTGVDKHARKVVFLDVTVPGHGDLRVRLHRDGDGVSARLRADNDGLARLLQSHTGELRQAGLERGVRFTSLEVVR